MSRIAPDSDEAKRIDAALRAWRQAVGPPAMRVSIGGSRQGFERARRRRPSDARRATSRNPDSHAPRSAASLRQIPRAARIRLPVVRTCSTSKQRSTFATSSADSVAACAMLQFSGEACLVRAEDGHGHEGSCARQVHVSPPSPADPQRVGLVAVGARGATSSRARSRTRPRNFQPNSRRGPAEISARGLLAPGR